MTTNHQLACRFGGADRSSASPRDAVRNGDRGRRNASDRTGYAVTERLPAAMPTADTMVARRSAGSLGRQKAAGRYALRAAPSRLTLSACCDSPAGTVMARCSSSGPGCQVGLEGVGYRGVLTATGRPDTIFVRHAAIRSVTSMTVDDVERLEHFAIMSGLAPRSVDTIRPHFPGASGT